MADKGGAPTWLTGTYDPELDLVYWGTGNGGPWNPATRGGDSLYICSVLAIRPTTGELVWHYQFSPGDPYDYDGTNELVLADLPIERPADQGADAGQPQRLLLRARPHQRQADLGQALRQEGQLGQRHRHGQRPADRHADDAEGAHHRAGDRDDRGLAERLRRQELDADELRPGAPAGVHEHHRPRHERQVRAAGTAGRPELVARPRARRLRRADRRHARHA